MAYGCRRLGLVAAFAALFFLDRAALGDTRIVHVGQGGHFFVDSLSGNSTSTVAVGDTIEWDWSTAFHSTTSGTCATTCMADGLWDSGVVTTLPHSFSRAFNAIGTFHYFCSVHLTLMQGDIVVVAAGPAPTVTSIDPTSGPADSGVAVTVGGTNFIAGATVSIGGAPATGVTFQDAATLHATTPVTLPPGTLNDVTVAQNNPDPQSGTLPGGFFADFLDVPQADLFHSYVEKLIRNGVTAGCGAGNYCRDASVTRAQMAVFLLKSKFGSSHTPPACTGTVFDDVPCTGGAFDPWIEELASLGVTGGCQANPPLYCPGNPVNRQQMAVFLLKAKNGSSFVPPACAGVFNDVACPSLFADWIEQLYADGVTGGCGTNPLIYCPTNPNTRGQMAVFLVKNFSLP